MKTTTTTTAKALKIGQTVKWKSGAAGTMTLKKGKVISKIAAGKVPNAKRFAGLRVNGKARNTASFIVSVGGKFYWPRTGLLNRI